MKIVPPNALTRKGLSTLVGVLLCLGIVSAATPSHALLFEWSFTNEAGFANPGETIFGTIDGLVEGSNDGTGLTIQVTSTPTGALEFGVWEFIGTKSGGDAFTVAAGDVTFADASYCSPTIAACAAMLFFGTNPSTTWFPELAAEPFGTPPRWGAESGATTFVAIPEPSSIFLFGVSLIGLVVIGGRRRQTKYTQGYRAI